MKNELENLMKRQLLYDENYINIGYVFISYRIISEKDIEIHIAYNKNKINYGEALFFLQEIKKIIIRKYNKKYNFIASIPLNNIAARSIAKKFGMSYLGVIQIECVDHSIKNVARYFFPRGKQNG